MTTGESTLYGLPKKHISELKKIFAQYPVKKVVLYGSRAMGNFRPNSDIDLTLIAPDLDLSKLFEIQIKIDDLLMPYKVDLSLFHEIDHNDLKKHITEKGIEF